MVSETLVALPLMMPYTFLAFPFIMTYTLVALPLIMPYILVDSRHCAIDPHGTHPNRAIDPPAPPLS